MIFPIKGTFRQHQELKLQGRSEGRAGNQQEVGGGGRRHGADGGEERGPTCFSFAGLPAPAKYLLIVIDVTKPNFLALA